MTQVDLTKRIGSKKIHDFVAFMEKMSDQIGFKVSARGWAYILEQHGFCTKDQFDKVQNLINRCRQDGLLPVDFVAEEAARAFEGIHIPDTETYGDFIKRFIDYPFECDQYYTPNWWDGEEYYIQMVVEKIDLVTLFQPICEQYHIPIANSKGWSSILQRAEYCRRFAEAENKGLKCVLLYCGDHDPDGLRISDTLRKNLEDIQNVMWGDGQSGYDPGDLEITRFGLDYDFIIKNKLTWIDNLITGSGKDLGSPAHPNYKLPYLQQYLKKVGRRKCEANSLVISPEEGRALCERTIQDYLGADALARFAKKRKRVRDRIDEILDESGVRVLLERAKDSLEGYE